VFKTFTLSAIGGGGYHALACVYKIPPRIAAYHAMNAAFPKPGQKPPGIGLKIRISLLRSYFASKLKTKETITSFVKKQESKLFPSEPDKKIFADATMFQYYVDLMYEACHRSLAGFITDAKVFNSPIGFSLKELSPSVKVTIHHGELNMTDTPAVARASQAQLPNCEATYFPNEGIFSIFMNRLDEILDSFK